MTLPPSRFDLGAPVPSVAELGRVHLVAIGGAGMSAVARLLLAHGVSVSGSDAKDSEVLRSLEREGALVHVGHDPAYLDGVDTVVVSSAIRDSNPEFAAARERGLRVLHRAQALAATTAGARVVAVAGANGKTTTTSLLTVALTEAGCDPSFAIGGELAERGTNAHLGGGGPGHAFVVEADESDGSFLVYRPEIAVVTSVQPDHLDHYGDLETVEEAYRAFAATVGRLLVVCADDPGAARLADWAEQRAGGPRVLRYGRHERADLRVGPVRHHAPTPVSGPAPPDRPGGRVDPVVSTASLTWAGRSLQLRLQLPGDHNVQNAAAAFGAAVVGLGVDPDAILAGLAAFSGTRRRFESLGEVEGVRVVDDYAHNPGKVAAVMATARQLCDDSAGGRVLAVFQPHLYSRTRDFADQLGAGLALADVVVVMDVYAAREDPLPGVTGALVADAARKARPDVEVLYVEDASAVATTVAGLARSGDLVLTIGAGDVTAVGPQVLQLLTEAAPARVPGIPDGELEGEARDDLGYEPGERGQIR